MTVAEKIHVQIGQVKIGHAGQTLNAILGSCIGLGLLSPKTGVYGLAHCLLSKSKTTTDEISGRHVDQALRSLQTLMDIPQKDLRRLQAIVVGGANMTMPEGTAPERLVGSINARFAYSALRELGLRNIHQDVGGLLGRQVTINCTTGDFSVVAIPRLGTSS